MKKFPYIGLDQHGLTSLMVDGNPWMGLAGELKNSSSSNSKYMEEKVWPNLSTLGLDTVLLPVAWESIEPEEGQFQYDLVDEILAQARKNNIRLVLLWFGLWKNGESMYVPLWVKRDPERFILAQHQFVGRSVSISPLCQPAIEADAKAFKKLMAYLRQVDGEMHTVLMVQVENEIGFLGSEYDHSPLAEEAFGQMIPNVLAEAFNKQGTWSEAFGEDGPEYFMAWHYASAVERIIQAGKTEFPLPMFVNAWLEQHPTYPGYYPSGGPIARLIPLWKLAAPSIDLYAPDVYVSDFFQACQDYSILKNPLLLPEVRRDPVTASNAFYAFGHHKAILFSPFGIDEFVDYLEYKPNTALLAELNIDLESFNCAGTSPYLISSYRLLRNARPFLLSNRDKMGGFIKRSNHDRGCILHGHECDLIISYQDSLPGKPGSAGIWMELETNTFMLMGCRFSVEPIQKRNTSKRVISLRLEEVTFERGEMLIGRILNGDERGHMICGDTASCFKMTVGYV
ncbi:MAG: DUF5597 domain-containing protein [Clostridiales bacterium]|nr:DUF5597 domain-containing protein [Clostridiales bacterium]